MSDPSDEARRLATKLRRNVALRFGVTEASLNVDFAFWEAGIDSALREAEKRGRREGILHVAAEWKKRYPFGNADDWIRALAEERKEDA